VYYSLTNSRSYFLIFSVTAALTQFALSRSRSCSLFFLFIHFVFPLFFMSLHSTLLALLCCCCWCCSCKIVTIDVHNQFLSEMHFIFLKLRVYDEIKNNISPLSNTNKAHNTHAHTNTHTTLD